MIDPPARQTPTRFAPGAIPVRTWGLIAALLIGAFLRFWQLQAQSQFLDEAFTTAAAALPTGQLLQFLAQHDAHPTLFYLLAHVAVTTLHEAPTWYRWLTAPIGLLTIVATWGLGRRLAGDVAATVAALFVATAPTMLLFDRMFRMYGLHVALVTTSFWLLLAAQDATGKRRVLLWSAYVVVTAAMPSVLYLGALVVACQGVYALFDLRGRWPVLAAGALAVLALVPWIWGIREQWPQAGYSAGTTIMWGWSLARTLLGYCLPVGWYAAPGFDVGFTLVALAVLAAGVIVLRGGPFALFLAPVALQLALALAFHRNLIYGRYLIYVIPAYAIAFGAVCARLLASPARVGGALLAAAALAVNGVADTDLLVDKFYQLSDWNAVEQLLKTYEHPSDVLVFDQRYPYLVLRTSPTVRDHPFQGPERPAEIAPIIAWLDAQHGARVWYIENQPQYPDPSLLIKKHLEATRPRLREWLEPRAEASNIVFVALYGRPRHANSGRGVH